MTPNQFVFVYGTLKQGYCRHHSISQQTFMGLAATTPRYRLYDLGEYPGMIADPSGNSIEGELYAVDEDCLAKLDAIEGLDQGLYSRQSIDLLPPWSDRLVVTYIYEQSVAGHREIPVWPYPAGTQTKS